MKNKLRQEPQLPVCMNGEINIRVWHKPSKTMYWFNPIWGNRHATGTGFISVLPMSQDYRKAVKSFTQMDDRMVLDPSDCELMLYSGLYDRYGQDIICGDIVDHYAIYGYIVFEDGMFSFNTSANLNFPAHKQPMCYHNVEDMEIIGNIYENPELIPPII